MACQSTAVRQLVQDYLGSLLFANGEQFESFDYMPKYPQVTRGRRLNEETIPVKKVEDAACAHFKNWTEANGGSQVWDVQQP
jgi:hypothetical protein